MSTIAAKIGPGAQTGPREAFEEPRRSVHPVGHPRTGLRQPQGPAGRAAYLWTAGGGEGPSSRGPGDRAFVTPGPVTADSSNGGDDRVPALIQHNRAPLTDLGSTRRRCSSAAGATQGALGTAVADGARGRAPSRAAR